MLPKLPAPAPKRTRIWLKRRRKERKKAEEERGRSVEVIPDKTREAIKKGLVITNIY